jgi:hypothetical protein
VTSSKRCATSLDADALGPPAAAGRNRHCLLESMVRGEAQKRLDVERSLSIRQVVGALMTLHGASGTNDHDLVDAIQAGKTIVPHQLLERLERRDVELRNCTPYIRACIGRERAQREAGDPPE